MGVRWSDALHATPNPVNFGAFMLPKPRPGSDADETGDSARRDLAEHGAEWVIIRDTLGPKGRIPILVVSPSTSVANDDNHGNQQQQQQQHRRQPASLSRLQRNIPVVLFFHGVKWDARANLPVAKLIADECQCTVVVAEYPGFGNAVAHPRGGPMPEAKCHAESVDRFAWLVWSFVVWGLGCPPHSILFYGRSIGAAVALKLASSLPKEAQPGAIVLHSPPIGFRAAALRMTPFAFAVFERYDAKRMVNELSPRVMLHITVGECDGLTPPSDSIAIVRAAAARNGVSLYSSFETLVATPLESVTYVMETSMGESADLLWSAIAVIADGSASERRDTIVSFFEFGMPDKQAAPIRISVCKRRDGHRTCRVKRDVVPGIRPFCDMFSGIRRQSVLDAAQATTGIANEDQRWYGRCTEFILGTAKSAYPEIVDADEAMRAYATRFPLEFDQRMRVLSTDIFPLGFAPDVVVNNHGILIATFSPQSTLVFATTLASASGLYY